jgi:hypothetical protein
MKNTRLKKPHCGCGKNKVTLPKFEELMGENL